FSLLIIFIGSFLIIFYKKKNAHTAKLLEQENNFTKALLQTQIEIQEQTLTNISQELHDNVGQTLSLAKLNLNTLKWQNIEQVKEQINLSKDLITQSLINIRDIAKSMLGEKITEIGLQQAIQNELKILQLSGKYQIQFTCIENTLELTPQKELLAFRVIQEALHNIIKHADATKIDIEIAKKMQQILITITDNGKGFDAQKLLASNTGVGLTNMKNRAALINAVVLITSTPNIGTKFTLSI
ncbi:MAG: ATP-binding protein, partial [Ferruginibacter sp.]